MSVRSGRDVAQHSLDARGFIAFWAGQSDRAAALKCVAERTQSVIDATGRGLDLADADLAHLDLSGFDLRRAVLNRAKLHWTNLDRACLAGASLICPGMERTSLREADLSGAYLHAFSAQACVFDGADVSKVSDATGGMLHGCSMNGVRFDGSGFSGTTFYQCQMKGASFRQAELKATVFNECTLEGADLLGAVLDEALIVKCRLSGTNFRQTSGRHFAILNPTGADRLCLADARLPLLRLSGVTAAELSCSGLSAPSLDLIECYLPEADFANSYLPRTRISDSTLAGANLSQSNLNGASFNKVRLSNASLTGASAENAAFEDCSAGHADFAAIKARAVIFRNCDMANARFNGAYLYRCMITGDPISGMNLQSADFSDANMVQGYLAANLTDAHLNNAELAFTRLNQSILDNADLRGARLHLASLVKVSLKGANIADFESPIFVDRSPGLLEAIENIPEELGRQRAKTFLHGLSSLLAKYRRGST